MRDPVKAKARKKQYYQENKQALLAKMGAHYQANRAAIQAKRARFKHGIDKEQLWHAQQGKCAGCHKPIGKNTHTDHDHRHCSGKTGCALCVRALLCSFCNRLMATLDLPEEHLNRLKDIKEAATKRLGL